jgi:hypothetical protein
VASDVTGASGDENAHGMSRIRFRAAQCLTA